MTPENAIMWHKVGGYSLISEQDVTKGKGAASSFGIKPLV